MVLRTQTLSIYKTSNEYAPILILPTYSIIEAAEIERGRKENCFQVICEEKTYRLQARSEEELEGWLGALKSVVSRLEGERKSRRKDGAMAENRSEDAKMLMQTFASRDGVGGARTGVGISGVT